MGGVFRKGKAGKVFHGGHEVPKLYNNNRKIYEKPIRAVYPNRGVSSSENVLIVGSSNLSGMCFHNWDMDNGPHSWLSTFRNVYTGNIVNYQEGIRLPGYGGLFTFGRQLLSQSYSAAMNGHINPIENPLLLANQYDALYLEFGDWGATPHHNTPDIGFLRDAAPTPYRFLDIQYQTELIREIYALTMFIGSYLTETKKKIYIFCEWPRLYDSEDPSSDDRWRERIDHLDQTYTYYQDVCLDSLFGFLDNKSIGIHLVPFHKLLGKVYDDIQAGTAPASLTSIRMLFANDGQVGNPLDPNIRKHNYMMNYLGNYLINCLNWVVVHKGDLANIPITDGTHTVPLSIANYFKSVANYVANSYSRTGLRVREPTEGYTQYKRKEVSEIFGDSTLLSGSRGRIPYNQASGVIPFERTGNIVNFTAEMQFDFDNIPDGEHTLLTFNSVSGNSIGLRTNKNNGVIQRIDIHHEANYDTIILLNQNDNLTNIQRMGDGYVFFEFINGIIPEPYNIEGYTNNTFISYSTVDPYKVLVENPIDLYALAMIEFDDQLGSNINSITINSPHLTMYFPVALSRSVTKRERIALYDQYSDMPEDEYRSPWDFRDHAILDIK